MHTTFGLTRKSLSKVTGLSQATWVPPQRVPLKSHQESYRLDPVVLVKGYELCATKLCRDLVNGASCIEVKQSLGY